MPNMQKIKKTTSSEIISPPVVSVVMPVYNVQDYLSSAVFSVLKQTFQDFELILVDDGSTDTSNLICQVMAENDARIRVIWQRNRGLAGARNTGIRVSKGQYIAFLDSDDLWHPEKLNKHVKFLNEKPDVGVRYSASEFIDAEGHGIGLSQKPKCQDVNAKDVFLRNPIGNGSAPVIRKATLAEIAFKVDGSVQFFNEVLRQSEDIECWMRIITTTNWKFAGIDQALTYYRVNDNGLSANIDKQFQSWQRACSLMAEYAPSFIARYVSLAKAFQYRYLARRAIRSKDTSGALRFVGKSLLINPLILFKDPLRSIVTVAAACCLLLPQSIYMKLEKAGIFCASLTQKKL